MRGAADTWTGEEWPDDEETKRRIRGEGTDRLRPTDSEENLFVLMDPGDTPLPRRRPDHPNQAVSGQEAPPRLGRAAEPKKQAPLRLGRAAEPQEQAPWGDAASSPDTTERWQRDEALETTERWERDDPPETTERWERDDRGAARREVAGEAPRREEAPRRAPPPEQEPSPPRPEGAQRAQRVESRGSSSGSRSSASGVASGAALRGRAGRRKRGRRLGLGTKLALFGGLSFGLAFTAARFLPTKRPVVPSRAKETSDATGGSATGGSAAKGQTASQTPMASGTQTDAVSPEAPEPWVVPAVSTKDPDLKAPLRRIIGRKGTVVLTNGEEIDGRFIGFERDKILLGLSPNGRAGIPFIRIADLRLQDGTSVWQQSFIERKRALKRQEEKRRATRGESP